MTHSEIPAERQPATLMAFRQPCCALSPPAFTLEAAEQWALEKTMSLSADRFRLTSFMYIDYVVQHVLGERKTRYVMRLAQAENYGLACSLMPKPPDADYDLVGEDGRVLLKRRLFRDDIDRTALIDLVIGHASETPNQQVTLDQIRREKYTLRSRLFATEAAAILQRKGLDAIKGKHRRVHLIGATAGMIGALLASRFEVTATDMATEVVGKNLGGVTVCDETENERLIKAADLIIITGMTLHNGTLPILIETAKTYNTSTAIWAITGRNFGHYYTENGVDCVISDPSPFLLLPGSANIGIWRREI